MKTIVKLVEINDGAHKELHDGNYLTVQVYPRTEKIIAAFLNRGYSLVNRTQVIHPSIQGEEGSYSFYLGGWNYLFTKEIEDNEADDSEAILNEAISEAMSEDGEFTHHE